MKFFIYIIGLCFPILSSANIAGTHLQNFTPTTNGLDFVTVQSSKTLVPGTFNFSFFGNYAVNSLPFFKRPGVPSTQKFDEPNDKLMSTDIGIGLGLAENWDMGFALPMVISQSIDQSASLGRFDETGVTEFRFNTKYRIFTKADWGLAIVGSLNLNRIDNNPFAGQDPGATYSLEIAYDRQFTPELLFGFNLGYRLRDEGSIILDTGVTPIGDQITYSAALAYLYRDFDLTFIFEVFGSTPAEDIPLPTDREDSNLEWLAGAKYKIHQDITLHAGLGTEVYHGLATPDFRVYAGLHWQFGPFWSDTPSTISEPSPIRSQEVVPNERIVLSDINFKTGSIYMTPTSRLGVQQIINQLSGQINNIRKIIVEGHTDSVGSVSKNLELSKGRARTIGEQIKSELNLGPDMVETTGYGEGQPIASNATLAGRQKNRRVEIRIYKNN